MRKLKDNQKLAEDKKNNLPICHYLWIGSPGNWASLVKNKISRSVADHDLKEVIAAAKHVKNPIMFWCLDEHVPYYQQKFQDEGITNVKVCSIEGHLNECLQSDNELLREKAKDLLEIKSILFGAGRGTIKDRILFKDIFSLFLLYSKGGYTLDTNVSITADALPPFQRFFSPHCKDFVRHNDYYKRGSESWTLYSPVEDKKQTSLGEMLTYYKKQLLEVEDLRKRRFIDNALYHSLSSSLIVDTISKFYPSDLDQGQEEEKWEMKAASEDKTTYYLPLGVKKTYFNTHSNDISARTALPLNKDDVSYFQNIWYNQKDLQLLLEQAKAVEANKCVAYFESQLNLIPEYKEQRKDLLKIKDSILPLFESYQSGFWSLMTRSHIERASAIRDDIRKADSVEEVRAILEAQKKLFGNEAYVKPQKLPPTVKERWYDPRFLVNKSNGHYLSTVNNAYNITKLNSSTIK